MAGKAIACCGTRGRGEEKIKLAKRAYVPEDAKSWFPTGIYDHFRLGIGKRGRELSHTWERKFKGYTKTHPQLADEIQQAPPARSVA